MDKKPREIIYGAEVRRAILNGVHAVYRAVGTTLGSKGRNVSIAQNWGAPNIIHDGVTVAKDVVLENRFENSAAQQVILAAQNTNNEAGDGTTTATIITYAIVKETMEMLQAGANPMVLRKGMEKAVAAVTEELIKMGKKVEDHEDLISIANISAANQDMGKIIAEAIAKVGKGGIVTVVEGNTSSIWVEYKEGMEIDKGLLSPWFITDQDTQEAILQKSKGANTTDFPFVAIINERIDNQRLTDLLEKLYSTNPGAKVLVIADDFDPLAIQTLLLNKLQTRNLMVGVKSPEFGDHRENLLGDLAVAVGATVLGGNGLAVEEATVDDFGRADRISITKDITTIVQGHGKEAEIKKRITGIKKLLADAKNEFERDKLENRLAKLDGSVAVINVGAPTETEMRDKKERLYDAVNATKAAIAEGIVPGGGTALVRASEIIDTLKLPEKEMVGARIIKEAMTYPLRKLIENAGAKPDLVLGKILENSNKNWGYNVDSEEYEDLIKTGIIDPLKVTKTALKNAASVAIMLITTDCMIVEKREKPNSGPIDDAGIGGFND